MKPAAAEAKKAMAMQAMADQLAENNRVLTALTGAITELVNAFEKFKASQAASEKSQEPPVEPEALTAEERAEAPTEPVKPVGRNKNK
jgi:uncharacterized coiled-coil protein SlyX